jgi:pimeloyl-ACP methyl ester carboxylesterase
VATTNHEDHTTNDSSNKTTKIPILRWKIPVEVIAQQLDTLAGFDLPSFSTSSSTNTPSYPGDAFFIHGGQSRFVRHSHMDTIAHFFPNHMLTTIRGVGHWVHAEAPDDTLALLKRYLDR